MTAWAAAVLLAGLAASQEVPLDQSQSAGQSQAAPESAPTASTETTVVVASTETVAASTATVEAASEPPLTRPIRLKVHPESSEWEPVSLKVGGAPEELSNFVECRLHRRRVKGKTVYSGHRSKARAVARVHPYKGERMLYVSVFPDKLKRAHKHLELRFLDIEGFLEKLQVVAVTVDPADASRAPATADAWQLERKGVSFQEEYASSGRLELAAIDARPGRAAVNAGKLLLAQFGDQELQGVSLSYAVRGLSR